MIKLNTKTLQKIFLMGITIFTGIVSGKSVEIKPRVALRPVSIQNIAASASGHFFALPNCVTTGSVGIFTVSPTGAIPAIPYRFSQRDFYHSRGAFYFAGRKDTLTDMAFIPLQDYSTGASVSFTAQGDTMAVCGGGKISVFASANLSLVRTIDLKLVSRAVFSPDNNTIAAIADGKIYVLSAPAFNVSYTIDPENGSKFADVAFSNDGTKLAVFEYKNVMLEHSSRIKMYFVKDGSEDRQLPYFTENISSIPGGHFPLVSFLAADSALAVTIEKAVFGKVKIIKSVDGTLIREYKSNCHAITQNGTLFAAGGSIFETASWNKIGNYNNDAMCMAFASETYLLIVTPNFLQRLLISKT
jgi:WD40 repeat protein